MLSMDVQSAAMDSKAAGIYVGLSEVSMKKFRCLGGGPIFLKLGRRSVRYLREDLDRWLQESRRQNTLNPPKKVKTA
jgi:hypothetical protein